MQIQRFAEHRPMPWLNGRGESLEIASDRGSDDNWTWRLALAPVMADGPFSKIDGVDRQLVMVEGRGMTLTIDRKVYECKPLEIVSFRGEAMTSAQLNRGPIRDINLMTRRGSCGGSLEVVRGGAKIASLENYRADGNVTDVLARIVVAVEPTECVVGAESCDLEFGDAISCAVDDDLRVVSGVAVAATIIGEQR